MKLKEVVEDGCQSWAKLYVFMLELVDGMQIHGKVEVMCMEQGVVLD